MEKVKNRKKLVVVLSLAIIAVLCVPVLYACIYLGGIWDVYRNFDKVSVAFVNLDKSVTKGGKEYAVGKNIEDNIKNNKNFDWNIVSYKEAMDGVKGTKYYAMVEIPKDFSENIANAQDGKFKKPRIIYTGNRGRNYIISQICPKTAQSIQMEINSTVQKEISKTLVDNLYNVKDAIKHAEDATGKLGAGTQALLNGSTKLVSGTKLTVNGSTRIGNGLNQAAALVGKAQQGTQKLYNGSQKLSDGLNIAATGSGKLNEALQTISENQDKIVGNFPALTNGLNTLKSRLTKPNDKVSYLVNGASSVNDKTSLIAKNAELLDTSVSTLTGGIKGLDSVLHNEISAINNSNLNAADKIKLEKAILSLDNISGTSSDAPLNKASASVHLLSFSLKLLNVGTKQVSDGVSEAVSVINNNQKQAAAGLNLLINGANRIQSGSTKIFTALNTVTDKSGVLANGVGTLNKNSKLLVNGLYTANNGSIALERGLYTAADKAGDLTTGLQTLNAGSNTLMKGLQAANQGAGKLNNSLNDGYNNMRSKLKFSSDDMSKFISEPVTVKDNYLNDVTYYGEGLAPYILSIALWLGSMIMGALLSSSKLRNAFKSKFMNSFLGKFIIGSALVALQAIILSIGVIKILNINTVDLSQFYINNILISITFFSVVYGIAYALGSLGLAVAFIILMLQLASSAGTFPIETAPGFYKVINNIIPMSYSVGTLRMTTSGIDQSVLNHNIIVMLIFIIVFLSLGLLTKKMIDFVKVKKEIVSNSEVL